MQYFLIFCCQSHWWTPRPPTNHVFKCDVMTSCLAKPKNGIQWKLRASSSGLCMLCKFENIFIGPSGTWTGWTHIEHLLNACECPWMPMSAYWTAHEHPLSVHVSMSEWEQPLKTHWVHMNANEWALNTHWVRGNAIESLLNKTYHGVTMGKIAFVSELNTPWTLVSARECLWVIIEHPLNARECTWMPMSEYWTPPEHPNECAWMSMSEWEQPLNTHWLRMNAFE